MIRELKTIHLLAAGLIFMLLSILIYAQTWGYEYVLDDKIVITENEFTKKGFAGIKDILSTESFVGYFKEQKDLVQGSRYRPLSIITFAIEQELIGYSNPNISHIINYILYGFTGLLLMLCIHKLIPIIKPWYLSIAFLTALIWMSHAIHVEVVANIKGRDEILALLFSLGSFYLFFNYYDNKNSNIGNLFGAGVCFFLGLMSKESTITFLAVILSTYYFFRTVDKRKLLISFGVMIFSFLVYLALRINAVGFLFSGTEVTDIMNNPYYNIPAINKFSMICLVMLKYLALSFVPYPLTHDYYPYQIPIVSLDNVWVILSILIYGFMAFWLFAKWNKKDIWAFLIFTFIATISIYSNILFNIGTTMNDRFLYMSTIPTSLATVYALSLLAKRFNKKWIMWMASFIIVVFYTAISINRVPAWKDTLSLNESAIKVSKNSARANSFMGTALFNEAQKETDTSKKLNLLNEADAYVDRALEIFPTYYNGNKMKVGIAAEKYKIDRDLDKLLNTFEQVASVKPEVTFLYEYYDYLAGRGYDDKLTAYYIRLCKRHFIPAHNYGAAAHTLSYAIKIAPRNAMVNQLLGISLQAVGRQGHASKYLNIAKSIDPQIVNTWNQ